MPKTENAPRLLKTKDMADLIQVSPETLTAWRKKGLVPSLELRHVIRYNPERVLEALAKLESKGVK